LGGKKVEEFVEKECIPADALFEAQIGKGEERWNAHPAVLEELKAKARKIGLWNMFLPKNRYPQGAGFTNLEYGLMAEYLGKSRVASEVRYFFFVVPDRTFRFAHVEWFNM
jgi:acyl-CoA dehydrogenase